MYQLYTIPGSCSMAIHVLLNHYGQKVEIIHREDVPNYTDLVPTNQVPALRDGDSLLVEGAAIALHLIERHGEIPAGEEQPFMRWLMFNYATLHPAYSKAITANGLMPAGEPKDALMTQLAERISGLWAIVETQIADRDHMVGNEASIIDYLLAVYSNWGNLFPDYPVQIGPRTLAHIHRISQLPEFALAVEREQATFRPPASVAA